jgi:hypothetical protein
MLRRVMTRTTRIGGGKRATDLDGSIYHAARPRLPKCLVWIGGPRQLSRRFREHLLQLSHPASANQTMSGDAVGLADTDFSLVQ